MSAVFWVRRRGFPLGASFDALAPLLPITLAIIRVGCFLNADAYGRPTESWIALWLPDVHGTYAWRYPTQLVSIGMNLLLAVVLFGFESYAKRVRKEEGWPFRGFLFLLYVELYCLGRMYFEFWRDDMYPWLGPLTYTHLYCIAAIALASWAIWRRSCVVRRRLAKLPIGCIPQASAHFHHCPLSWANHTN